ncbi:putative nuclease HARBI1 [Amphibalanus amphitrite]|uniref:putative nuclease HARBI1 n=1 Tax=Amphibalanus amphitrite TaxID=1232801 RepID=UPI001C8FBCC3|nr:putative nuclease HARBI1 [Amphibalanus amphitrite]XP_043206336.1 putative nuclease HARBI1 [Amphibalanus amphitrite]
MDGDNDAIEARLQRIRILRLIKLRQRRRRRMWVRPVLAARDELGEFSHLVSQLRSDPAAHQQYLRLTPAEFDDLLGLVRDDIAKEVTNMRRPIPPDERLALTLRYLAAGGAMKTIAESYRIAPRTATGIIYEVCEAIYQRLAPLCLRSPTLNDWHASADDFLELWQLPNCIGALDGKHVALQKPAGTGSIYFNYKGFCSVVLMAVADARYRFTYISVGSQGSESDGGIFAHSDLAALLRRHQEVGDVLPPPKALPNTDEELPHFLVGDEAFPLQRHLMRPYARASLVGSEADQRRIFNYRLSRARRCVENAFGILAQQWRIYRGSLGCTPEKAALLVKATCALHNLLRQRDVDADSVSRSYAAVPAERDAAPTLRGIGRMGANNHSRETARVRQALTAYVNGVGSVPWQRAAAGLDQ